MRRLSTRRTPVLLLALALVLAGCSGIAIDSGSDTSDPPSGEVAADAFAAIETINATMIFRYDRPYENLTVKRDYLLQPQRNHVRVETLAPPTRAGNVVVSNASTVWRYNATKNAVRVQEYRGATRSDIVERKLEYIFDRLNDSAEAEEPSSGVGVSPLPVVPSGDGAGGNVSLTNVSIEYEGTATVAGRTAHVVHIEANESVTGLRNQTVWFDAETFYQLKARTVMVRNGQESRVTQRVVRASFGEEVAPARFEFSPPADATVEDVGSLQVRTFETRAALAANASMSLPDPQLPASFTFTEGRHIVSEDDGERTNSTSQILTRGVNSLVVVESESTESFANLTANETVQALTVGDRDAYYLTEGPALLWTCDDHLYQLSGAFPRERMVAIAESMVCD